MPTRGRIWGRRLIAVAILVIAAAVVWIVLGGGLDGYDARGAKVEELTIQSEAVGQDEPVKVVIPDTKADHPPLLVFLHGRGGDEDAELYQEFFDALKSVGERAPIVAFPDGGDSSYWHDRDSGDWEAYVSPADRQSAMVPSTMPTTLPRTTSSRPQPVIRALWSASPSGSTQATRTHSSRGTMPSLPRCRTPVADR